MKWEEENAIVIRIVIENSGERPYEFRNEICKEMTNGHQGNLGRENLVVFFV